MLIKDVAKLIIETISPELLHKRFLKNATLAEPEIMFLPYLCEKNAIALDIGANRGLYVHHLFALTKNVIAFEPLPAMQTLLRKNYGDSIRLETTALSDSVGTAELRYPSGTHSWATMEKANELSLADRNLEIVTEKVEVRTVDSFDFLSLGFMKIDVEGHEEKVIRGAHETLRRCKPGLLIEIEERHNSGAFERINADLTALGYEGFFLADSRLRTVDEFDIARDQPIANVGAGGKTGRYINNFMFVPVEKAAAFKATTLELRAS